MTKEYQHWKKKHTIEKGLEGGVVGRIIIDVNHWSNRYHTRREEI